jgi:hypothetical protein
MRNSWFEYPLTRPFTLRYLSLSLITFGLIWTCLVTLISVATVGYETVVIQSTEFNESNILWYEKLFPDSQWTPQSRVCQPSQINTNNGILPETFD